MMIFMKIEDNVYRINQYDAFVKYLEKHNYSISSYLNKEEITSMHCIYLVYYSDAESTRRRSIIAGSNPSRLRAVLRGGYIDGAIEYLLIKYREINKIKIKYNLRSE